MDQQQARFAIDGLQFNRLVGEAGNIRRIQGRIDQPAPFVVVVSEHPVHSIVAKLLDARVNTWIGRAGVLADDLRQVELPELLDVAQQDQVIVPFPVKVKCADQRSPVFVEIIRLTAVSKMRITDDRVALVFCRQGWYPVIFPECGQFLPDQIFILCHISPPGW